MAAPLGFEPRNVGIKIRCLRPTWRKGYKTLQIFKDQELKYMSVQHSWQACCFYATHKTKPPDFLGLGVVFTAIYYFTTLSITQPPKKAMSDRRHYF